MHPYNTPKRLAAYGLSVLLLASPSFVAAQEAPESPPVEPAFELGTGDMLNAADLLDGERVPKVEAVIANMLIAEQNAWREVSADDAVAAQQTAPKQGGFGRWLKKRWYIPVLVAAVIGAAAADDSDTGGDDEE